MEEIKKDQLVLVTGGTGFVGAHCILQLLGKGYKVKATLRSLKRKDEIINMLKKGGIDSVENLSFIEADLTKDDNWEEAVKDCDYVLHVASPISIEIPKHEDEMIKPAVEGTLRVLKAARDAGVKRVVITSSFAAVGYSNKDPNKIITEESWTDPNDKTLSAYLKSKTLAEKAAWDFVKNEGGSLELSVINPGAIFGPLLSSALSGAHELLIRLLEGKIKAIPKISFGIVDVRDVADLHIRAMQEPKAKGERFLLQGGSTLTMQEIAAILKDKLGERAAKVPTKVAPDWVVRLAAIFSPSAKAVVPQLGRRKNASNEKAMTLLGWIPKTNEEAIAAAAESLYDLGLVKS
jgi:nucleoside-diphosphate-sugar epimerase